MTPEKKQMIDWLRAKGACQDGREWAERECNSLADVWAKAKPEWLIWVACQALAKRKRVAMGAAFAERVRHLMTDQRSKDALDMAHRYGRGEATDKELTAAEREWQAAHVRANFAPDWSLANFEPDWSL